MNKITDFKECPHCGDEGGYYVKLYVSGWTRDIHDFNGQPQNWHIHDSLKYGRETKYYYCLNCDKRICKRSKPPVSAK
jgi:hypothetical protein